MIDILFSIVREYGLLDIRKQLGKACSQLQCSSLISQGFLAQISFVASYKKNCDYNKSMQGCLDLLYIYNPHFSFISNRPSKTQ